MERPIDLSLVKPPDGALMFPNPPAPGEGFSFAKLRNPRNTTKEFVRKATVLGFAGLRLHDLRGTHETLSARCWCAGARGGGPLRS